MSEIYLIKPLRSSFTSPLLTQDYIDQNAQRKIETDIFLDLNILSKIRKVIRGEERYENTFLPEMVKIFINLRGFYLSPGFALQESNNKYKKDNYEAFELFLSNFLPHCHNAYNASKLNLENISNNRYFFELEPKYKNFLQLNYASLLVIHLINIKFQNITVPPSFSNLGLNSLNEKFKISSNDTISIIKFFDYLNIMKPHILGAIELIIAQLTFFDWNQVSFDTAFKYKKIIKNFIKASRDADQLLANTLNAAIDISYYRTLAWKEQPYNPQCENWLLTADKGLKALSDIAYYVKGFNGNFKFLKEDNFFNLSYWRCIETIQCEIMNKRQEIFRSGQIPHLISFDKFIEELEKSIRSQLK